MRIAVISDTHMPKGARALPEACVERLRAADLILHGGDSVAELFLRELRSLGPPVEAVYGNMDEPALKASLPKEHVVEVGEVRIGMLHIPGPRVGREARLLAGSPAATRSSTATPMCPRSSAIRASGSSTRARRPSGAPRRPGRCSSWWSPAGNWLHG